MLKWGMDNLRRTITTKLKLARNRLGLTQAEVAEQLGMTQNAYNQVELGRSMIRVEYLAKLPQTLGMPVGWFLGEDFGELTDDEAELVELYRGLTDGLMREKLLAVVWAFVKE